MKMQLTTFTGQFTDMRIALAQINLLIGDFDQNLKHIAEYIDLAKAQNVDIVCFPELATCGYPPRDFLEFDDFINNCEQMITKLCALANGIAIVIGSPSRNPVLEGKDLYNSVYFLAENKILGVQHKTLLPTYDIFDEYRYFEPAHTHTVVEYRGARIALTVCEDIWNVGNENPLYTICPIDELMPQKPDFIINASASPFSYKQADERLYICKTNVERYGIPLFYVNCVGAQTEVIFDGGSMVLSPDASIYDEMPFFVEKLGIYDLKDVNKGRSHTLQSRDKLALIHDALIVGIKDYFQKLGFNKAILGLSGGIDSAVATVLMKRALGSDNVRVLLMPSQFSSDHSVNDAQQLADNLQIQYDIVPIESTYQSYINVLEPHFKDRPFNVTEENLQARIRGMLLMAFSNKFGNILINTSNKSEMAVGYGTLYGDMCGGLSVIGDLYKMEVYALAEYMNKDTEIIPKNTIAKPPSAELRHDQKDSDSLPDYDILDQILFQYIEEEQGPDDIVELGFDEALVSRILKLVNRNEFKRYQTAPVLRISPKAFGMGRRMPIVGKYLE